MSASRERQTIGRWGEEEAARYLAVQGYTILTRNYRTPAGELDIVARDGDAIVFVEVKTRRTTSFGPPQAAVTAAKAAHIIAAAQHYLLDTEQIDGPWRIDVVAVFGNPKSSPQITLIRSAVEAN
ncbi:MAG: YraN family protein [Chloroflexi bacterium]|nr:YraN family protein [Chloroflexota bacterium]